MRLTTLRFYSIFALMVLATLQLSAQKVKFKLSLQDSIYIGTMSPKWFDEITIRPIMGDGKLQGAIGTMQGIRFGISQFTIEANSLSTTDSFMIKTNNGWYPLRVDRRKGRNLQLLYDMGYREPANPVDLRVLYQVSKMLSSTNWDDNDDRQCESDFLSQPQKLSLYCALKQAYWDQTGDFNHRAAALELVRSEISLMNPQRKYQHQLMEFNNEQDLEEILKLLQHCQEKMEQVLK